MRIEYHYKDQQGIEALAEDFKSIADEKLNSLARFHVYMEGIKVEIIRQSNPHFGKSNHTVTISTQGGSNFVKGEGSGESNLKAFDEAVKNFEFQLRKIHEKKSDINHQK
jgi:ribosomal subunit interface protein